VNTDRASAPPILAGGVLRDSSGVPAGAVMGQVVLRPGLLVIRLPTLRKKTAVRGSGA
jgi:hypothetical protein